MRARPSWNDCWHPISESLPESVILQKLSFFALHYAALAVVVLAAWGAGQALFARLGAPPWRDRWLEAAMAATLGLGLYICVFQWLGIAGALRPIAVAVLVGAGALAALAHIPTWWRASRPEAVTAPITCGEAFAYAVLVLVGLPTLFAPLAPPAAFDEVMYHLPYAREVAGSGTLGIHEWLRYPWFPYNFNLLFAAGTMLVDDVFPHLLSAFAQWLSVLIVYRLGVRYLDRITACIGAGIWLALGDYRAALIDGAVALFVLAACVALWWWNESVQQKPRSGVRWLVLAAFLLGVAAGSKYQALTFLPLVGLFVLWRERRVGVWSVALAAFALPCIYWYARNWLQTGDPFNPIGARLFGFTNWNAGDFKRQLDDVQAHAELPNALYWPVVLVPFTAAWKRSPMVRAATVFCAWSIGVWALSSRYPRYLTAAFPLIALMAALGWRQLYAWLVAPMVARLARTSAFAPGRILPRGLAALLLVVLVGASLRHVVLDARAISPTPAEREVFLREHIPGYQTLSWLRAHPQPGKLYQIALSDAIYYAPRPVWGDTLGPWRYTDYVALAPQQFARKLAQDGFGTLVVHTGWAQPLLRQPGFEQHFVLLFSRDGVNAYRVAEYKP